MSGEILGGVRKAYASKGDDATLSRFVKIPGARHRPARQDTVLRDVRCVLGHNQKRRIHGALKMDKWDQMMQDFYLAISERNDEKLIRTALGFVMEIARTVEQAASDLDRIATVLEKSNK